jgi:hypothetical protein
MVVEQRAASTMSTLPQASGYMAPAPPRHRPDGSGRREVDSLRSDRVGAVNCSQAHQEAISYSKEEVWQRVNTRAKSVVGKLPVSPFGMVRDFESGGCAFRICLTSLL